jgi:hypothetical protein
MGSPLTGSRCSGTSPHKCAARKLAEAGCSEQEILSVTGHRTSAMVAHYTKGANKKRQASAAILKLEKAR